MNHSTTMTSIKYQIFQAFAMHQQSKSTHSLFSLVMRPIPRQQNARKQWKLRGKTARH